MSFDDMLDTGGGDVGLSFGQDASQWLPNPDGTLKWRGGTLVDEPRKTQCSKFAGEGKRGEPDFWPNGDPKMQLGFPLQTNERDGGPLDDGKRVLYARIQGDFPGDMLTEIRRALTSAGGGMTLGCQIYVALVELKQSGKGQPQRLYKAHYIAAPSQGDQLMAETAPQQQLVYQPAGPQHPINQAYAGQQAAPPVQQQPQYQQAPPMAPPSYAGAPAASNHPQWGPAGPQDSTQQYPPPNGQQAPPQYAPLVQQPPAAPAPSNRPPWEQ